ncbi:hypothetical protein EPA93_36230 [Ktedonosporobacter rubrisoli]|uniref:Uncharacterized protein n=1 Tax=Ktedonosporobacter rubrisoli TaxID=2509675 RepID=A0A4V0YZW4_KTERU|nr:hypothetical protein [Ktedonosporobacter rubrisoli]QBD81131.1 hypothetical protein EPA93_36230 [Ktedonosporobacter rubrisoli]
MPETTQDIAYLRTLEQVATDYQHRPKLVRPGQALSTPQVYLKWYDLYPEAMPIEAQQAESARTFFRAELEAGRLALQNELGFIIHHRCSSVFIFYVCTWRNENELWETIYYRDENSPESFQRLEREAITPTYCVWVLGVVGHEMQAWTRYLYTQRDEAAKYAYTQDQLSGQV